MSDLIRFPVRDRRAQIEQALAAQRERPGTPNRQKYEGAVDRQRSRPGAPNRFAWQAALARQQRGERGKPDAPTPERITMALDWADLYGPEVDRALGVEEPTVDMWEAGLLVPTREQVARLAVLTGVRPGFFYQPAPEPVSGLIVCTAGGCEYVTGRESEQPDALF